MSETIQAIAEGAGTRASNRQVKNKLCEIYDEVFAHDGFGEFRVEMRLLKRGQKEVILHCGKQYRFVVNYSGARPASSHSGPERRSGGDSSYAGVERRGSGK